MLLALLACAPQYEVISAGSVTATLPGTTGEAGTATAPTTTGGGEPSTTPSTGTTPTADLSAWDDARLVVLSPASGDFLPWGDTHWFEAQVQDADGQPMDFEDITWSSDVDAGWSRTGTAFEDDTLDVGEHAITATAELPNGDRLAYTVGGVLVQSIYAGTYAGSLQVDTEVSGYVVSCLGTATATVDPYGEEVTGEADCVIALSGYELPLVYTLEATNVAGEVSGDLSLDVYGFPVPAPFEGTLTEDGVLTGGFEVDVLGTIFTGSVELEMLSRDVGL